MSTGRKSPNTRPYKTVRELLKRLREERSFRDKAFVFGPEEYLSKQVVSVIKETCEVETVYCDEANAQERIFSSISDSLFSKGENKESVLVLLNAEHLLKWKKEHREKLPVALRNKAFAAVSFKELSAKEAAEVLSCLPTKTQVFISHHLPQEQVLALVSNKLSSKATPDVTQKLIEAVGTELSLLKTETDKLLTYPGKIDSKVADSLIFPILSEPELSFAVELLEGNKAAFLKGLREFLRKNSHLQAVGAIQFLLRSAIKLKLGKSVRLKRQTALRLSQAVKDKDLTYLYNLLKLADEAEFALKSGEDKNFVFMRLIK